MPSYRLRDAAVLVGAVIVGAAAGFNGGWLAAVPPRSSALILPTGLPPATSRADPQRRHFLLSAEVGPEPMRRQPPVTSG